ncbi:MAG: hypothetical protein GX592_13945, partial [Clostridiales bacterium]|nr:hypothetical protein [Clostridiales bacterium]
KDVAWASDDETVATVDPTTGLVAAVGPGTATISATSVTNGDAYDEITVIVRDLVTSIMLLPAYRVVDLFDGNEEYTITPVFTPDTSNEVYWRSSAPDIAEIDQNGKVTCKKSGYAFFFAYTSKDDYDNHDSTPTAPHAISLVKVVQHVTDLKLQIENFPRLAGDPDLAVGIGQTIPIDITVEPNNATDAGYIVTSSDPNILQVTGEKGNGLKGKSKGVAIVTISASDAGSHIPPKTLEVWVVAKGVTSFKLSKTSISVTVGSAGPTGSYTLTGTSSPSGASYKGVRWYSADPTIATIESSKSNTGKVVGVKPGTTYVYGISTAGHIKKCTVTVNPLMPSGVKITNPNGTGGTLYVGEMLPLTATVSNLSTIYYPEHGNLKEWRSSKPTVALVNDFGLVYAVSAGTTTIYTKTVNGKVGSYKITVKNNKCYNDSYDVQITDDNNEAMYVDGKYTLDYKLFLNGAGESDPTLKQLGGLDGYGNVHFKPLAGRGLDIDYKILAYNTTNTQLLWRSKNSSIAKIDPYSGVLTGKKAASTEIWAKSRLNSNTKQYDKEPVTIRSKPGSGLTVYDGASAITELTLTYGDPVNGARQLTAQPEQPGVAVGWASDNEQVAKVDASGRVTAVGIGKAIISAFPLGLAATPEKIDVTVKRQDGTGENEVKYRALVIGMYQTSGKAGYLPFGSNSTSLVRSAIAKSSIDDARYKITFKNNSYVTSEAKFKQAVKDAFEGSQEGDVSIIFLHSHGTVKSGEYRWHLSGSGTKAVTIPGSTIISAVSGVKGHVVLCVASCYSGNDATANSIITRAKNQDATRHQQFGDRSSLSIITSTDGKHQSGYLNTASSIAVDFFSVGFNWALRDAGELTVSQMLSRIDSSTDDAIDYYIDTFGTYSLKEKTTNDVQTYVSPRGKDVKVFKS